MHKQWPRTLWIVRHGQSAGNVARDAAEAAGLPVIDIVERDIDTPLSELGRRQAVALGHWFGELPAERRPEVLLCSPYVRARETAQSAYQAAKEAGRGRLDELGLTKDRGSDAIRSIIDGARDAAKASAQAAVGTYRKSE